MRRFFQSVADYIRECDKIMLLLCTFATGYGCIAVLTATRYLSGYRPFLTQVVALFLGLTVAIVISNIDYSVYKKLWPVIAIAVLIPVILTFFIGFAPAGTDDKAWLRLPGGLTFQPAELLKIGFIVTFSLHLSRIGEKINRLIYLIPVLIHGTAPVVLIHFQGDDGTAIVFGVIMLCMLFMAGLKLRYFIIMGTATLVMAPLFYFFVMNDNQQARLLSIFNLEADLQGTGWQQWRGRIALANGGLFGQGLFKGDLTQTGNVPEAHNDFIFVSIGEELGLLGCMIVVLLLAAICLRTLRVGKLAREQSGSLMCAGIFGMILAQTIINLGMCLSVLPVIGVTLPFFSAGGTSLVCLYLGVGVVVSVYKHRNARMLMLYD